MVNKMIKKIQEKFGDGSIFSQQSLWDQALSSLQDLDFISPPGASIHKKA